MAIRALGLSIRLVSLLTLVVALSASMSHELSSANIQAVSASVTDGAVRGQPTPQDTPSPVFGTGVIRGRVVDGVSGRPIARARVRLMGGITPPATQTDVDGSFVFSKLVPGRYSLSAEKATYMATFFSDRQTLRGRPLLVKDGQTVDSVTLALYAGGVVSGRILDPFGDPMERALVQLFRVRPAGASPSTIRMQPSNDIGGFTIARLDPGTYILRAEVRGSQPSTDKFFYGASYYPGVATMEQAQPITLAKGESISELEWPLLDTTRASVSGRVIDSTGAPVARGLLVVRRILPMVIGGGSWSESELRIRPDGTFEAELEPGEYRFEVRIDPEHDSPTSEQRTSAGSARERGMLRASVGADSITDLVIPTSRGGSLSGRFVFEGNSAPPDLSGTRQSLGGGRNEGPSCDVEQPNPVKPDGTFAMSGLWGICQIHVSRTLGVWQIKSIAHGGEDVTGRSIVFDSGQQISDLRIVFTDRKTELHVDVIDNQGAPVAEYVGLAWPTDRELWGDPRKVSFVVKSLPAPATQIQAPASAFLTQSANIQGVQVAEFESSTSRAIISAIAPGDYFVAALDDVAREDLLDPEFFEQLSTYASRVTVSEGESKLVLLRRSPGRAL